MLRSLSADDPRFKTVHFRDGLNLLIAETTPLSRRTESRNGAGKSSVIELLHFLLGSDATKHICTNKHLKDTTFRLEMDWPGQTEPLRISRTGNSPRRILLNPDIARSYVELQGTNLVGWRELIDQDLFGLPTEHRGVSGRALLSYLIRRESIDGFIDPTRWTSRAASSVDISTNLAYLLGQDWQPADRHRDINKRDSMRRELRKVAKDPAWGSLVGNAAELRGRTLVVKADLERLSRQVREFHVVPEYETLKQRADELTKSIQAMSNADIADQRNLEDVETALTSETDVDIGYLRPVFEEVEIMLPDHVQHRFSEVQSFHEAVIRNRRHYREDELRETRERLQERKEKRRVLGTEQQEILKQLSEGGALESLEILHRAVAAKEAELAALSQRIEALEDLEATTQDIKQARADLVQKMSRDLVERRQQEAEVSTLFLEYVRRLYGSERSAYLTFVATETGLRITPVIDHDASSGIGRMKIFCFDLAMAVVAHRYGRAPDFLVHDGYLYDGVDARQVAHALDLGAEVARDENMQYIVTMTPTMWPRPLHMDSTPTATPLNLG